MNQLAAVHAPSRPNLGVEHALVALFVAACALSLVTFPLATFAMSTFLLINLPAYTHPTSRRALAILAAVSLSLITGARPLDPAEPNDIVGYYDVYLDLAAGDWTELGHFGKGFEVGLTTLFYLWGLVLPPLSVNGLMLCISLVSALLLVLWVERTFYADVGVHGPAVMGICLLMINLYFATQLSRQFVSLIVLLYAFTAQGRVKPIIYVLIATSFHLTALPFYALYLLARRGPAGWLMILAVAFVLRAYFVDLLVATDTLPEAAADKLVYYTQTDESFTDSDLGSLRMIFLLSVVSILAAAVSRFKPDKDRKPWLALPWVTAAVHFTLLPVPLASLRSTLMVHSVLPGLIAYKMFSRQSWTFFIIVANTLCAYKIFVYATADALAGLTSTYEALRIAWM